ncbi:fam-l protein [Plasmodium malariae]|uniref:Fam-l protein n=1 Tax=Plasmodium malariae TaxID=5858 RepID=A0A1D3P9Z1_PLAMA|nr:fam-l protein [Plasmodium malariae]SCN12010.1 fam-l protein [Plasmodium malariae]
MEKKVKLLLFFKIYSFIFLSWICYLYNYRVMHNKILPKCYTNHQKLYARNYRLLAKYKKDKASSIVCLKEWIPNGVKDKKDIYNNDKWATEKRKLTNGNLSQGARVHKKDIINKSCIFETKKYSYIERKIFKELDYENFVKNNRTISNKVYKKIIRKKLGSLLRSPILFLFFLLSIGLILDVSANCGFIYGITKLLNLFVRGWFRFLYETLSSSYIKWMFQPMEKTPNLLKKLQNVQGKFSDAGNEAGYNYAPVFFGYLIYVIPFIILGITLILGVYYYHKKVKKYEKIKLRKV